ncbi:hypothetical protein [Actinoplanes sp. NPDC023714]|uniref:hypothetical protein n=1 Tax=Actinoplanes sp. NPDC023714 TaxID=3154322 RepID=UPI0033CBB73F
MLAARGSAVADLGGPKALSRLGLAAEDVTPAESIGLLETSAERMAFRHPFYRAAVLEVVGSAEVRRVPAALAAAAEGLDLQRRAWHRGLAVLGTDEAAAQALDDAAALPENCAGAAAAVGLRTLAVAVSPPGGARDRRELDVVRSLAAVGHHAEARHRLRLLLDRDEAASAIRADAIHHEARLMPWDTPLDSQPSAMSAPGWAASVSDVGLARSGSSARATAPNLNATVTWPAPRTRTSTRSPHARTPE